MRLFRVGPSGDERPHVELSDGSVYDVGDRYGDFTSEFFDQGGLEDLASLGRAAGRRVDPPSITSQRWGPPIPRPSKIVCIGLNYHRHAVESGAELPREPVVFFKSPSTLSGPNDDVLIPPGSDKTDWEIELGVAIGTQARFLADEKAAREVIAGYAISNDLSERHFQLERGGQWVKGKSFDTFNPLGPYLVTADEVPDVGTLRLSLTINGEVRQDASASDMIFSVEHIVRYLSTFMTLEPGDLVNTGTPSGVGLGMSPPVYLRDGDVMELEITGLGRQRQTCRAQG